MAFAIAGILTILTLLFAMLQAVAAGMSEVPTEGSGAMQTLCFGLTIAVMIAASHWLAWPW
jgi:hypothetical protein